jgi:membrane-bound metal-dependent hydrolase YbcI (DUF457 family)
MVKMSTMPSPFGHALAGIAVAWVADLIPGQRGTRTSPESAPLVARAGGALTLICAGLAAAPDLDLLLDTPRFYVTAHRTITHSVTAVLLTIIIAAAVTGWVTRRRGISTTRIALMCGAAYASHLLLDWLAIDRNPPSGVQMLWPWSPAWFVSGLDVFPQTELRRFFTAATIRVNIKAMTSEGAILLPLLAALWLVRVKALAGLAPQLARRDHAAQKRARPVL